MEENQVLDPLPTEEALDTVVENTVAGDEILQTTVVDGPVPGEDEAAITSTPPEMPTSLSFDVFDFTGDNAQAQITLEEVEGDIQVTVNVVEPQADIRGLFFNIANDDLLSGLTVNGADITDSLFGPSGNVSDLGGGDNVNPRAFDAGVEIGTPGIGQDDIAGTTFILSHDSADLTLDQFVDQSFGVRLTSVGTDDREGSSKLEGVASFPVPPEVIEGDETDETLVGGDSNDVILGEGGDDAIIGQEGEDTCVGGEGNDFTSGEQGDDTCLGGAGDDEVFGGMDDDDATGGEGNDLVSGDLGDDFVSGEQGDDTCLGGDGEDEVYGGQGDDSCEGGAGNDLVSGDLGDDTCLGGDGDDSVMGGAGNDVLEAGAGNDLVDGGEGNDSLMAGAGDDSLMGGDGDDTLMGGEGNHTCEGGAGTDKFMLGLGGGLGLILDFTAGSDQFVLLDGLTFDSLSFLQVGIDVHIEVNASVIAIVNNISVDILAQVSNFVTLDAEGNIVEGEGAGEGGPNTPPFVSVNEGLEVPSGSSQVIGFESLQYLDNEQGTEEITYTLTQLPTNGELYFDGELVSGPGFSFNQADLNLGLLTFEASEVESDVTANLEFTISDGTYELTSQGYEITVLQTNFDFSGSTGDESITGTEYDDTIVSGSGNDTIYGGNGQNVLEGGEGDDCIFGGNGKDTLIGGDGDDKLDGGNGPDVLNGGKGNDTLTGGNGPDIFVYDGPDQGVDLITDFKEQNDKLQFAPEAFGNLSNDSFTKAVVDGSTEVGDASLLILAGSFASEEEVAAALAEAAGDRPVFGVYTEGGQSVLVFAEGSRFEVITKFAGIVDLDVQNFIFAGEASEVPGDGGEEEPGTSAPDILDFSSSTSAVDFTGTLGDDSILGSAFNDTLNGGDGNDTLFGGSGSDLLTGSSGADVFGYNGAGEGVDTVTDFTPGEDKLLFVSAAFGEIGTADFNGVSVTGTDTDISGAELVIFSGTYADLAAVEAEYAAQPGAGTNPVFGVYANAAGETVLFFDADGAGTDAAAMEIVNVGSASLGAGDFLFTGSGTEFGSTPGDSPVTSPSGMISDTGPGLYDFSSSSVDLMFTASGPAGGYTFLAGAGSDALDFSLTDSPNTIVGGDGNDTILGGMAADSLEGGLGEDSLVGGDSADTLLGGSGADLLTGGTGADLFVYTGVAEGGDILTDFETGADKFQFASSQFAGITSVDANVNFFDYSTIALPNAQALFDGATSGPGFFLYDNGGNTGLAFDADGTTAGGAVDIASFSGVVIPSASDFTFI